MAASNPDPGRRRLPTVAVALLLTFLAALACAAWVVRVRTDLPRQHAQTILQAIAGEGLAKSLGASTDLEWFLEQDASGAVLGIHVQRQVPVSDGYVIGRVMYDAAAAPQATMSVELWRVSNDISASDYRAAGGLPVRLYSRFPDAPDLTFIRQAKHRVQVERRRALPPQPQTAEAPAPANLIPEGAMDVAVRYVRDHGEKAIFNMIVNHEAILDGRIHFTTLRMRPIGGNRVEVIRDAMLPDPREVLLIYHLDDAGRVQRVDSPRADSFLRRTGPRELSTLRVFRRRLDVLTYGAATLTALTEQPTPRPNPRPSAATAPAPPFPPGPPGPLVRLTSPDRP